MKEISFLKPIDSMQFAEGHFHEVGRTPVDRLHYVLRSAAPDILENRNHLIRALNVSISHSDDVISDAKLALSESRVQSSEAQMLTWERAEALAQYRIGTADRAGELMKLFDRMPNAELVGVIGILTELRGQEVHRLAHSISDYQDKIDSGCAETHKFLNILAEQIKSCQDYHISFANIAEIKLFAKLDIAADVLRLLRLSQPSGVNIASPNWEGENVVFSADTRWQISFGKVNNADGSLVMEVDYLAPKIILEPEGDHVKIYIPRLHAGDRHEVTLKDGQSVLVGRDDNFTSFAGLPIPKVVPPHLEKEKDPKLSLQPQSLLIESDLYLNHSRCSRNVIRISKIGEALIIEHLGSRMDVKVSQVDAAQQGMLRTVVFQAQSFTDRGSARFGRSQTNLGSPEE